MNIFAKFLGFNKSVIKSQNIRINMLLYFHENYNMILFVLNIFNRIQIKTFNFF
jgi:hypothetical protein